MHPFLVSLFLFFLCKGSDGYTYPPTPITYAGMTIECTEGCGLYGDPNLDEISSILDRTIYEAFGDVFTCSEIGDGELLRQPVTWECETFYKSWDWESANGIWPSDEDLISYKEVAVDCYPNWEKLDLRQREALINKKWPAEIKVYEEQKNILQSILNERLSYD